MDSVLYRKKSSGQASLLIVVFLAFLLGTASVAMNALVLRQIKRWVGQSDSFEGFYGGEIAAWHGYYRGLSGTPLTPDTRYDATLDNEVGRDLPDDLVFPPDPYIAASYVPGTPLNLKTTLRYDAFTTRATILRKYQNGSLGFRTGPLASKSLCGEYMLGAGKEYRTCLAQRCKWTPTSTVGAPTGRYWHTAVWTGSKVIIFGGKNRPTGPSTNSYTNTGGVFDPATNTWTATSTVGAPLPRVFHSAVWTGTRMIIWGGLGQPTCSGGGCDRNLGDGFSYDPVANTWSPISASPLTVRSHHVGSWTGSRMILYGGCAGPPTAPPLPDCIPIEDGALYDPATNTWSSIADSNPASTPYDLWTGTEMLVWAGTGGPLSAGRAYRLSTDTWSNLSTAGEPPYRDFIASVWTGTDRLIWGGYYNSTYFGDGGKYNRASDTWSNITLTGAPSQRSNTSHVWTGSEMLVWGGIDASGYRGDGASYNPGTDTWREMCSAYAPDARYNASHVWTGNSSNPATANKMIVWGGRGDGSGITVFRDTGGIYSP